MYLVRRLFLIYQFLIICNSLDNGVNYLPAMGWSTWNYFFYDINESLIINISNAIVKTGLKDAGFIYINIDAGYLTKERNKTTNELIVNSTKFPNGIEYLSNYIHSLGLKLGVYTDLSNISCGYGPGSYGYYNIDANTFANKWKIDYLKVDFCTFDSNMINNQYKYWNELGNELNKTGRPIYYSICPKMIAPNNGTSKVYYPNIIYSTPINWNETYRRNVANSWLVEYVNNVDNWYSATKDNCVNAGYPCGFITNIDAMIQMTKSEYNTNYA